MRKLKEAILIGVICWWFFPSSVKAVIPAGIDRPPPILYSMGDWRNCDYWTSYSMGSQYAEFWSKISVANNLNDYQSQSKDYPDHYDWSWFDNYLSVASGYKNEKGEGKPVIFTLQLLVQQGDNFLNLAPQWLKNLGTEISLSLPGCPSVKLPNYLDSRYQTALKHTIYQMGRRYNNDPRLKAVFIAAGLDDEARSIRRLGGCDYYQAIQDKIPDQEYNEFVKKVIRWYKEAFPQKAVFLQPAAATFPNRAVLVDYAASLGVGIKMNGLSAGDTCGGYSWGGPLANKYHFIGFADYWHKKIPVAFEPKTTLNNPEVAYWIIVQGLAHKVDLMDIQSCPYRDCDQPSPQEPLSCHRSLEGVRREYGINHWIPKISFLPQMIKNSLGVHSPEEARMIWIVLRENDYPAGQCQAEGERGDWDFFLYRPENIVDFSLEVESPQGRNPFQFDFPQSKTKVVKAVGSGVFSRQARRTDEERGQIYMTFKADKNWPYKKEGHVGYRIVVTLKDTADSFSLEYYRADGQLVRVRKEKGGSGQFKDFEFVLPEAVFNNQFFPEIGPEGDKGADFRINCNNDGDELVHRVIVEPLGEVKKEEEEENFWLTWIKELLGFLSSKETDKDGDGEVTLLDFNWWRKRFFQ